MKTEHHFKYMSYEESERLLGSWITEEFPSEKEHTDQGHIHFWQAKAFRNGFIRGYNYRIDEEKKLK